MPFSDGDLEADRLLKAQKGYITRQTGRYKQLQEYNLG